jgi:hypothetical protein
MKIAHLILAHNYPAQLERLINRLAHPDADVYIHLDKKTLRPQFEHLQQLPNVFFIQNRVKVYWGSYNIVQATLNAFNEILQSGKTYQFINLLSGQDYPLVSSAYIHDYLKANQGTAFMNYALFDPAWTEALPRIREYHLNSLQIKGRYMVQKLINKILPRRTLPNALIPVGRSQWFTISTCHVRYIVDYWESNPHLQRFIKLTWAPDEFIFQTILYNSMYREQMVNNDLRYIDWSESRVSPKTLTIGDAKQLLASGKLFARKFDQNKDVSILNLLDKHAIDGVN